MKATPKSKPAANALTKRQIRAEEKALHDLRQQPAQLTPAKVEEFERLFRPTSKLSQYRRLGLVMLANSGQDLIRAATSDQTAAADIAESIAGVEYAASLLRSAADMLETSAWRASVAVCARADALDLLAKARGERDGKAADGLH